MIVYGRNVLEEVLKSHHPVRKVYLRADESSKLSSLVEKLKKANFPFTFVPRRKLAELCGEEKNQGVVIDLEFKYADEAEIKGDLVVLLDHINDPHNLGAITRTAVAAGAGAIVIPKDRSVDVTPSAVKVSAGALLRIPVVKVTNLPRTIDNLKKKGYWIYGADMKGTSVYEEDFQPPVALVFGNEGEGLSRLVKQKCDQLIAVPMYSDIDSLNVSVSAGIIMFEIARKIRRVE
ncbi:MAG: RNA methyltransferase, TrmH family, group 3 [Thermotoga sp. 50_1627]|uniref:23S rRNA (guanosine(2251)-2'-O)-methyltransferase RlmB n=1 Tax=Pseudothermotoga sp. TaxID=2033661 RepID=UPI00076D399D|nr:MAG: RNA methyltransferase, TrmH family, group 3 [Thermotoga sp. 50_64]KUK23916.1 MAG: RNA methyltransferase, TrmH family, group 3 [Thermotoga sp. 50_1627]MBC7115838.1 23S rRNA (guanosine(2251)-2'-O)-methyltransferase RlmB [Pseudothermotoga sp.]MDK2923459.1 rRNA (guanosine2251-2-O)-methyltransferase [Pseudothermotoga sp.]